MKVDDRDASTGPAARDHATTAVGRRRFRAERTTIAGLSTLVVLLVAFAWVLDTMLDGEFARIDGAVLTGLRDAVDLSRLRGPDWIRALFTEITHLGGTVTLTLATALVIGLLLFERRLRAASLVLVSVLGGTLLSSALKLGIDRPRPDLVPHLVEATSPSFPSGHAMLSAVVYLTLGALLARFEFARGATRIYVLAAAILMTFAIGFSRVVLGVHWPSDVVAGWCLGAAWATLCIIVARVLERRGALAEDAPPPVSSESR